MADETLPQERPPQPAPRPYLLTERSFIHDVFHRAGTVLHLLPHEVGPTMVAIAEESPLAAPTAQGVEFDPRTHRDLTDAEREEQHAADVAALAATERNPPGPIEGEGASVSRETPSVLKGSPDQARLDKLRAIVGTRQMTRAEQKELIALTSAEQGA